MKIMQSWYQNQKNTNKILLDLVIFLVILIVSLLTVVSSLLLFGTRTTEVDCVRSPTGVDCTVVGHALFFQSRNTKIHDPIAIDINECDRNWKIDGNRKGCYQITAEAKFKDSEDKIIVVSGYDLDNVRAMTRKLNTFITSPHLSSYHGKYP